MVKNKDRNAAAKEEKSGTGRQKRKTKDRRQKRLILW